MWRDCVLFGLILSTYLLFRLILCTYLGQKDGNKELLCKKIAFVRSHKSNNTLFY